ncbi:hypothetical protein JRO89_XS11G0129700 [Xanthoceras sorbifolium]|uniref:Retrovirus-related Pol polyprotein from transposon TNT 1-94-like beta-barrel domain-containing protein n=1 Tax=Xanthoceras sorbifolium TaxID=99658 RepID=A0ABQ8HFE8_9ROSI|nr:hypothetical protein JRO89_XS11G0129700 [Xanthoceras sorbifolium]
MEAEANFSKFAPMTEFDGNNYQLWADTTTKGALAAKHQHVAKNKKKKKVFEGNGASTAFANVKGKNENQKKSYPPCQHCGKNGYPSFRCWIRPDAKCAKCNQMGHEAVICKNRKQQQGEEAKTADQEEEDHLFVATCFSGIESSESWLIDSSCTNHMTYNKDLFRELSKANSSKVRVGNGKYITVNEKGTVAISTCSGTKFISDVLYVPEIDQNLLSVGQLIEKGNKVVFEDKSCLLKDADGKDIFKVKMKGKNFALNLLEEEQTAFQIKENITDLWHKRLGHYHHQGLLQMKSEEMPQTGKIIISRDVHFMEDEEWNWDDAKKMDSTTKEPKLNFLILDTADQSIKDWENEIVDDRPIRGIRPLSDVYQRCNVALLKQGGVLEDMFRIADVES